MDGVTKPLVEYLNKPLPEFKFNSWKKGYQDLKDDDRYKKITARMCLTHTTGFPNWRWFEADKKIKFKFDPGTRYSYSGEGLYLLQYYVLYSLLLHSAKINYFCFCIGKMSIYLIIYLLR